MRARLNTRLFLKRKFNFVALKNDLICSFTGTDEPVLLFKYSIQIDRVLPLVFIIWVSSSQEYSTCLEAMFAKLQKVRCVLMSKSYEYLSQSCN